MIVRSLAKRLEIGGFVSGYSATLATNLTSITSNLPRTDAYHRPFSWASSVNWDILVQCWCSSQQLVKRNYRLPKSSLDATFYGQDPTFSTISEMEATEVLLLSVITSILNNTSLDRDGQSNDAYDIFRMLPRQALMQSLKALPLQILDVLAERVLAAAIVADDGPLVSVTLSLGANPHEHIRMGQSSQSELKHPVQFAVGERLYSAAKALVKYICQNATQEMADELLAHVFKKGKNHDHLPEPEMTELIRLILAAGARPTEQCLHYLFTGSLLLTTVQTFVQASNAGVTEWLRLGLVEGLLSFSIQSEKRKAVARDVLQYVLLEELELDTSDSPDVGLTLRNALRTAILRGHLRYWAIELILPTMKKCGYNLDEDLAGTFIADESFQKACSNGQWTLGASLMLAQIQKVKLNKGQPAREEQARSEPTGADQAMVRGDFEISFEQLPSVRLRNLISQKDVIQVRELLDELFEDFEDCDLTGSVEHAVSLGQTRIAVAILQTMDSQGLDSLPAIVSVLEAGQTAAASQILKESRTWCRALDNATVRHDFTALETLVHQQQAHVPYFRIEAWNAIFESQLSERRQLCLRLIAFHAIEIDDKDLCAWLFEVGLDASELIYCRGCHNKIDYDHLTQRPTPQQKPKIFGQDWMKIGINEVSYVLPSLVAIAAEQDSVSWIHFLFAQGVHTRDTMALFQAVNTSAELATIQCLLAAAMAQAHPVESTYGSAALRHAVRSCDLGLINILCEVVNIDAIESSTGEYLENKVGLSPLCEAIAMNDPALVDALLKRGAAPNTHFAHEPHQFGKIKSVLPRLTPLLAAIDMQSLPIVQLLVEAGAELHYKRALGVLRTPLQRAAEVGNLEILQYLISKGASIDTKPKFSGATELQLAAMNGFVGVATYLLELGAKVNHPPAEGEGRTAFEAAAENGRIDMMLLLVQSGVQLHLEFGDPPESQYVRAKCFAEMNGFMAAKRFVESLLATPTTPTEELRTEDAVSLGLYPSPTVRTNRLPGLSP
ncbi:hypothetical protein FB567DRAFT_177848 [Paraphoma chrysanthemicola]|uniref:Ankyrin n=1 Tax=Paraphoma chrysanthemicola TaxID=798071 RepID=A0A8K0W4D7_9PLEO|nr:hypothetical protein FB567DRAFT_177848 [Paraphoma chrysanthemicola]